MGHGSSTAAQTHNLSSDDSSLQSQVSSATRTRNLHKSDAAMQEAKIALRYCSLFENMDEKAANLMAPITVLQTFRAGTTITAKGEKFDKIIILKSGCMASVEIKDGFEITAQEFSKPFSVYGVQSFQNDTPSEETLKSKTACTVWKLERTAFEETFRVSLESFLESQKRKYRSMQMQLSELDTDHSKLPHSNQIELDSLTRRVLVSKMATIDVDAGQFATIHSDVRWDRRKRILETMQQGCPVDLRDEKNNSLLIVAVQNGHLELARLFLELGAQIDCQNDVGATALHYALEYDYPRIARLLRANGASETLLDAYGSPPSVGFTNRNSQSFSKHLPKNPIAKPYEHQPKSDFVRTFMMSNKLL